MTDIIVYELFDNSVQLLEPSPTKRQWMDATNEHFANRCLPMLIANQNGWVLPNQKSFTATWDGTDGCEAVKFESQVAEPVFPLSHFGYGIITWTLPFLFRTEPGVNLYVRGPINDPKDGIAALEGVVETDWNPATFTMNWKFTRPGTVTFAEGETFCLVYPQERGYLESVSIRAIPITQAPSENAAYESWRDSRGVFVEKIRASDAEALKTSWQKDYFQGKNQQGHLSSTHQSNLKLCSVKRIITVGT